MEERERDGPGPEEADPDVVAVRTLPITVSTIVRGIATSGADSASNRTAPTPAQPPRNGSSKRHLRSLSVGVSSVGSIREPLSRSAFRRPLRLRLPREVAKGAQQEAAKEAEDESICRQGPLVRVTVWMRHPAAQFRRSRLGSPQHLEADVGRDDGDLASIHAPITVPAWACAMTAKDQGELGSTDSATGRHQLRRTLVVHSGSIRCPAVWDALGAAGSRPCWIGVPPSSRLPKEFSAGGWAAS